MIGGSFADQTSEQLSRFTPAQNARFFSVLGDPDAYGIGNRVFARANVAAGPSLNLFGFYTHNVDNTAYNTNHQGMNFGMNIDFKKLLQDKAHLF